MIEINLIPDVKLELLKAKKQRRTVISFAIITAIAAGGVVVLLGFYTFAIQSVAEVIADNSIKSESEKLFKVEDLGKTLTIQKQLTTLQAQHDQKHISSRLFDIISTAVPNGENEVVISRLALMAEESTVEIEGEASNGYEALEVFKKTLGLTKFKYELNGEKSEVNIAETISDGERRYGENSDGKRVLRFELSFTYPSALFAATSEKGTVVAPNRQNATDSLKGVPTSLFSASKEGN